MSFWKSILFVPCSSEKMLRKSVNFNADALILDIEDGVSVAKKEEAREILVTLLKEEFFSSKDVLIRINPIDSQWGRDDLLKILPYKFSGIVVPKVNDFESLQIMENALNLVERVLEIRSFVKIIAMIETPSGVLNAKDIAKGGRGLTGLIFGAMDLTNELHGVMNKNRDNLIFPLSQILYAARAGQIAVYDAPHFDINDEEGLRAETKRVKELGYNGKCAIHPSQLSVINEIFTPSDDEVSWAKKVIEEFNNAAKEGRGVSVVDGRLIEKPTVAMAENILKKAGF